MRESVSISIADKKRSFLVASREEIDLNCCGPDDSSLKSTEPPSTELIPNNNKNTNEKNKKQRKREKTHLFREAGRRRDTARACSWSRERFCRRSRSAAAGTQSRGCGLKTGAIPWQRHRRDRLQCCGECNRRE